MNLRSEEEWNPPHDLALSAAEFLSRSTLGVNGQLFLRTMRSRRKELLDGLTGRRLLVVGGAGSIGSATVRLLLELNPHTLHVMDTNENSLVELIRNIRSMEDQPRIPDFRALPVDFGSGQAKRFLLSQQTYDLVFNFAAIKHVRSEKDVCSILQMLDTNLLKLRRLLRWNRESHLFEKVFVVSTDKAVNPISILGASKRAMEIVLFNTEFSGRPSSARLGNVAFSNGSLLSSFIYRLSNSQPLAVPRECRRFFFTPVEAARICVLSAVVAPPHLVVTPAGSLRKREMDLVELAERFLNARGLHAVYCEEADEARVMIRKRRAGEWPLLLTHLDTSGERKSERFKSSVEKRRDIGIPALQGINPPESELDPLESAMDTIERFIRTPDLPLTKGDLVSITGQIVPEFSHNETGSLLDDRM